MNARPDNLVMPLIRGMRPDDLDAVVAVEERAYDFPWSRGIFNDCLLAGYYCSVLTVEDNVCGYAIMSVAAAEGHILNLCVDPEVRRRGLGRMLLNYLLARVDVLELDRLFLEVRPSNDAAIALYAGAEFAQLGVRKAYYKAHEGREDALVFVREFGGSQA